MDTKVPKKPAPDLVPYRAEDLKPRNATEEIASEDAFIARNRDAINQALAEGERDIARGDTLTLDQVSAELARRRKARRRKA